MNGAALRAALASITDASATRPYVIQLAPGIYELGHATLAMKPDISIAGAGAAVTRITGTGGRPRSARRSCSGRMQDAVVEGGCN